MQTITSANSYTDFEGFAALRAEARQNTPAAIKQTAQQFEALFVQMMLKGLRDTVPDGGLFGGDQQRMYQDMYDKQISINISQARGIGLAEVIELQLGGNVDELPAPRSLQDYQRHPVTKTSLPPSSLNATASSAQTQAIEQAYPQQEIKTAPQTAWTSADDFVNDLWPYAEKAAFQLGVDPDVLVAQSALETGWGKHTRSFADGQVSFSLFGIKADSRWAGKTIAVNTLEFREGSMQREQARFRAYDSVGEAFDDYVDFIGQHPRYQQALQKGYNPDAYARELQQAGYATDPDYARKIERIRHSDVIQQQSSSLKNPANVPLFRQTG